MGSNISVNDPALARGWDATVGEYLGLCYNLFGAPVANWTVNFVRSLALNFKYKIQNTLNGSFLKSLEEIDNFVSHAAGVKLPSLRTIIQQLATCHLATNQDFVYLCNSLVTGVVNKVLTNPVVRSSFKIALENCLTQLGGVRAGPIADALAKILTDAISQLSQKAAGSLAPDITTNALVALSGSRTDIANAHAKSFFVTSVTINGFILLFDLLRTFRNQGTTREEYKQYAKKKITTTFGTIVGGTAGGYVATLIAPNNCYVQFFGGMIGGLIGEHFGITICKD